MVTFAPTSESFTAALQAFWGQQPRAVRLFTPALEVRWDNTPDRPERYPVYRDARGQALAIPAAGAERNAWPVTRALAEGQRCTRNYWVTLKAGAEAGCFRVVAYPVDLPGEGPFVAEEIERIDRALCHDERLRRLDGQLSEMMESVVGFLSRHDGADFLRLRLANPNLQSCHQIKGCRRKTCPAYDNENPRCWEIPGTLCPESGEGLDPVAKFQFCNRCDSYLLACPDPLTRIGENFNRLLSFLQLKYEESVEVVRQAQQTEKLASLGELTLGIVHEIKNPLSVIATRLDCLGLELDPLTGAGLAGDLTVLRNQIARMQQFLEDLLAFSRPAEFEHRPLQLNEIIGNTLPLLGKTLDKAHIVLESRLDERLPRVLGDPVAIQQILLNLMLNARDATPEGGRIRIGSRRNPKDPGEVLVEVRDSGQGMAAAELRRIFSPFYSTKAGRGGTGLGLAVCSRIMSQHDGRIAARSRPGRGATFSLIFKCLQEGGGP